MIIVTVGGGCDDMIDGGVCDNDGDRCDNCNWSTLEGDNDVGVIVMVLY